MNLASRAGEGILVLGLFAFFAGALGYVTESVSAEVAAAIDVLALIAVTVGIALVQFRAVRTEPSARRLTRPTDYSPTNVGAGAGLVLGAGIAVTTALFVGSDVALAAGYGTAGGLLVGAMVGRILESAREHETPGLRVVTLALLSGTVVGGVLGLLAAWGIDESLLAGVEVGGAAGALVAVLVVNVLVASIHRQRRSESVEVVENSRGA